MSLIMTFLMKADPKQLEEYAAANPDAMRAISDLAVQHGVMAHRFYGSEDGQVMVVDEWPDLQSAEAFAKEAGPQIQGVMGEIGIAGQPEVTHWRKLESHDEVGWGS